jgi:hypothetical protein
MTTMTKRVTRALVATAIVVALGACQGGSAVDGAEVKAGKFQLTTDILAGTDVARMNVTATRVDCATGVPVVPAVVESTVIDLEDMYLPGGNTALGGKPYAPESQHLFADHFFWLDAGCYDAAIQPLDASGAPSADCAPAAQQGLVVVDGELVETHLISQCQGPARGALDVIASINNPPELTDIVYGDSKFTCTNETSVCVSAKDPNKDPLAMEWTNLSPGLTVVSQTAEVTDDGTRFCAGLAVTGPGDYELTATVYDQAYGAAGLENIEALLPAYGSNEPSHDAAVILVHSLSEDACINSCQCEDGFEPLPAADGCTRTTTSDIMVAGPIYTACRSVPAGAHGMWGARYPSGTISLADPPVGATDPLNDYWGAGLNDSNARLQRVGIWACEGGGQQPLNEWIGYNYCINAPEAGDYMIGLGADNQMRAWVDGVLVFDRNTSDVANFRYYWIQKLNLTSGPHIVTLEGLNTESQAGFAAEVSGPFPAGSLVDDAAMIAADFDGNKIFSTLDALGTEFDVGRNAAGLPTSGYSCPDGQIVNTCGAERVCTMTERLECL